MSLQSTNKLKNLLESWPPGYVATSPWLRELGISSQLIQRYLQSGWIEALGVGAFKKTKDTVEWYGAVASLQQQLLLNLHVGGPTAFSIRGSSHYIRLGKERIFLFSPLGVWPPKWFTDLHWPIQLDYVRTSILPQDIGVGAYKFNGMDIKISAPERAILECLHISTKRFDLLECYQILEGQLTLRPDMMQRLLSDCSSVRVKRLFLYMAEKAKLPLMQYLDIDKIDLGTGDRSIVKKGVYNAKYGISIPKELADYV